MFTTPKLLEALALRLETMGTTIRKAGITGIFSGGTEFTPQWNRFAHEELLDGVYMTPTYGNTLMGLAASAPSGPDNGYKITYYAPQPRAVDRGRRFRRSRPRSSTTAQTGRVKLTTLTKEFFMPGFLERDEGEREPPCEKYPVGRRQRRAAVPRLRGDDDGGGVLNAVEPGCRHEDHGRARLASCCRRSRPRDLGTWSMTATCCNIPVLRWGEPYDEPRKSTRSSTSSTGEPIAQVSRANGGLVERDMRKAQRARDVLREIPIDELIARVGKRRRAVRERDAADGRRHADARRVRARAVGDHRACPSTCAART